MKKLFLLLSLVFTVGLGISQTLVDFYTNRGNWRVQLREDLMPITAGNFISLVDTGFYDGVIFHRVVKGFVIQGGDPLGTGFGGPGYTIQDEYHPSMNHDSAGVIAMAKTSQPNSAGSQFYFTLAAQNRLDTTYAVFGSCIQGLENILAIGETPVDQQDRPIFTVRMDSVRIVQPTSGIQSPKNLIPVEVFPNPFAEYASIRYQTRRPGWLQLQIFDLQGRLVFSQREAWLQPGVHSLLWKGADRFGNPLPNGVYTLKLNGAEGSSSQKLIRMR